MKRKEKDFLGRVTPLFASTLAPPVVEGEGSGQPSEPQPAPFTAQPKIEEQIPEIGSANTPGSDKERIEQDDLTDFVPPTPYDSPLSGGHTPGSDEGRPNINELMAICTNLSNRVLALEQSKTTQDLVIRKLKKKIRKLEKKLRARTLGMKLFKVGTSKRKSLDEEYVFKRGRKSDKTKPMFDDSDFAELDLTASIDVSAVGPLNVSTVDPSTRTAGDIFEDEMMTIADTLMDIRSTRQRTTSVVIYDVEEEPRRSTSAPTAQPSSKDKGKALMAKLERMQRERATQEEASNAALIAEFDNVQARMEKLYEKEQEWIKDFIRMDFEEGEKKAASSKKRPRVEPDEESVKRQKIRETLCNAPKLGRSEIWVGGGSGEEQSAEKEKELSEEELQKLLVVVPVEEKLQRYMHDPLVWRLYDTCGVHHVSSVRGHDIFMLVEKEYPLTREILGLMMVTRILVKADSKMSRELLRNIFYQANRPR
ncbi:hypothetical protein Tco_0478304 [Tanacetum coccineum]